MPSPAPPAGAAPSPGTSSPQPATVAKNANPGGSADSAAEAEGRRILSTAFVMMGPGGHLTVELRDGRTVMLRDVVMRRRDYCGAQVNGGSARAPFCGGYGDVAAARPGGAPVIDAPDPAVPGLAGPERK